MHHNDVDFWRYLQSLEPGHPDIPSARVCRLLQRTFQRWREKPLWLAEQQVGHLFRGRQDLSPQQRDEFARLPLPLRKSAAIRRMFEVITNPDVAATAGTFDVDADEIIVGTVPPFSVGQGKEFVRYLTEEEEIRGMLSYLNELSPMGHIVPDHGRVVQRGLQSLIDDCQSRIDGATNGQKTFYQSAIESLRAVISYAESYADRAEQVASLLPTNDVRKRSLSLVAARLRNVPAKPASTFHEAVQAIHIVHCALHWTLEIVPLGRLDQILQPFYERDIATGRLNADQAQEILDCFWVKLDERVILNYRFAENRFTPCDGVLTGLLGSSNFDQGCLLNQWMQQVTIGGVLPDDSSEPRDAANDVTKLCLECARRLPFNSPTLDLRVHKKTPPEILRAAARALLSGGAHPVLLNDDRIIDGFQNLSGVHVPRSAARNYACDGCYETMVAGESEFSFGYVSAPDVLEKALNRGAGIGGAGPIFLRGFKDAWRTPPAAEIESWDKLLTILRQQVLLGCHRYLHSLLLNYGNKADIAPSPLLSCLIADCIETGRDLYAGGARYHIFAPLMVGISTAVDSLYAIKTLVFESSAVRLEELVSCLASNWGSNLIDRNGELQAAHGLSVSKERIAQIRELCSNQPKFGFGHSDVDQLAWDLINMFCDCVVEARESPVHAADFERLRQLYNVPDHPFEILFAPGVGTFEQYVFSGTFLGASADGRTSGTPIASDLSPAPLHVDQEPFVAGADQRHGRCGSLRDGLRSYADPCMNRLIDGAPADFNIPEDCSVDRLSEILTEFAQGRGGSIATFTVANPETLAAAQIDPEKYNLLRVRMGGWTEFFVALFPAHQAQHRRRPLYV